MPLVYMGEKVSGRGYRDALEGKEEWERALLMFCFFSASLMASIAAPSCTTKSDVLKDSSVGMIHASACLQTHLEAVDFEIRHGNGG